MKCGFAEVFGKSSENNIAQLELSVGIKREARKLGGVRKFGVQGSERVDDMMTSNERESSRQWLCKLIFEHVEYIHERVLIYGIGNNESRDNRTENNRDETIELRTIKNGTIGTEDNGNGTITRNRVRLEDAGFGSGPEVCTGVTVT